jgi:hypothetical protein
MESNKKIVCTFCGSFANVRKKKDLRVVSCPHCKRETELDAYQEITDISLGGLYLKGDIPDRIGVGQVKDINVKLPTEKYVTRFKAKVMRKTYGGIGCQLIYQNGHEWATLNKFLNLYNFYSDTKSS